MVQQKKLRIALPLVLSLTLAAGMFIGYALRARSGPGPTLFLRNEAASPLQQVMSLVRQQYVDDKKLDSVEQSVIDDLLAKLDPHSVFVPAAEAEALNDDLHGQFGGVGLEYQVLNDTATIIGILAKGPAAKAGLLPGDQLLGVAGQPGFVADSSLAQQVRKALRGAQGSEVKVKFLRNGQLKEAVVARGPIPLPAVNAGYMVNDTTGYIGLTKFSETAYPEFMQRLEQLQKTKRLRHLIVDLRGNGGGLLGAAVNIADEFLDENKLVTYTQGAHQPKTEYRCKRPGLYEEGKLTILIDQGSASASEILAGALQDWDRARIVGRRSFGKGLVQQQYDLTGGNELRLTVARYYTPLGRNIQKSYAGGLNAYKAELGQRSSDSAYAADTSQPRKKFRTPKGRILYDNGGIQPDLVVKGDSNLYTNLALLNVFEKGLPTQAALACWGTNKALLQQLKQPADLSTNAAVQSALFKELNRLGAPLLKPLSAAQQAEVVKQTTAQLAKLRFGSEAVVQLRNAKDAVLLQAL